MSARLVSLNTWPTDRNSLISSGLTIGVSAHSNEETRFENDRASPFVLGGAREGKLVDLRQNLHLVAVRVDEHVEALCDDIIELDN